MNADELRRLEELADAATPGPYTINPDEDGGRIVRAPGGAIMFDASCWEPGDNSQEDAAFIAVVDPTTIKRFVARVRELEECLGSTQILLRASCRTTEDRNATIADLEQSIHEPHEEHAVLFGGDAEKFTRTTLQEGPWLPYGLGA